MPKPPTLLLPLFLLLFCRDITPRRFQTLYRKNHPPPSPPTPPIVHPPTHPFMITTTKQDLWHDWPPKLEDVVQNETFVLPKIRTKQHLKDVDFPKQVGAILSYYDLWHKSENMGRWVETISRPSIGCSVKSLSPLFKNNPPSSEEMCNISTVLIYSEQHSGTSLLSQFLQQLPFVSEIHELFCCDAPICDHQTLGITTYSQLACGLHLEKVGVTHLALGLQWDHFWGHSFTTAVSYPKEHNLPVILLRRDNYLAHFMAGTGVRGTPIEKKITHKIYSNLPELIGKYQQKYVDIYCSLKDSGVKVLEITYEDLVNNNKESMMQLLDFLHIEREGIPLVNEEFQSKHVPMWERVMNLKSVAKHISKHYPKYMCLLHENCTQTKLNCQHNNSILPNVWKTLKTNSKSTSFSSAPSLFSFIYLILFVLLFTLIYGKTK